MLKINPPFEILYCSIVKRIHKVMLSDVIVNILHPHMILYVNIMKHGGFYIRLFQFSQNSQGVLSTKHYMYFYKDPLRIHEPKDKCPCLNCLPPKRFTVSISLCKKK